MKKIYFSILMAASVAFTSQTAHAQTGSVTLTPNAGAPVEYESIGAAYAAIPASPAVNYLIEILPAYTGSAETYPIQLTSKGLLPGGATITIRPAAGNTGEMIQRVTPASGAVLQINGGDNIILDGRPGGVTTTSADYLTINDPFAGSNANRTIELLNAANNNTLQYLNCVAAGATAAGAGARNVLVGSTTTTGNNNNTIQYCAITGGLRGIQDFGLGDTAPNNGTIVRNNTVSDFGAIGIFAGSGQSNITIENNTVSMQNYNVLVTGSVTGIQQQQTVLGATSTITGNTVSLVTSSATVTGMSGIVDIGTGTENVSANIISALSAPSATALTGISAGTASGGGLAIFNISRNKISGLTSGGAANIRGMSLFPLTGSTLGVTNNFVSIMDANTSATAIFGLLFGNITGPYTSNVYYNSIRIGGSEDALSTGSAYGIYKASADAASVYNQKNNISIMERTGGGANAYFLGFYLASTNGVLSIDYNTYYASDESRGFAAGGWDGFIYKNGGLDAYKAGAGLNEQNSNFMSVSFVSSTDLHLADASLTDFHLQGTLIPGISTDIDGDTRSLTAPTQGADEGTSTLPVEFTSFNGENKGKYNQLVWILASENNNNGFEVERSKDAINFSSIGFVKSKASNGFSATQTNYGFTDNDPLSFGSYYRLKQLDKDGRFKYSAIINIKAKAGVKMQITKLYPNPVVNRFNIVLGNAAGSTYLMTVTDISGRSMFQKSITTTDGENIVPVSSQSLAPGTYIISVKDILTNEIVTAKFIK